PGGATRGSSGSLGGRKYVAQRFAALSNRGSAFHKMFPRKLGHFPGRSERAGWLRETGTGRVATIPQNRSSKPSSDHGGKRIRRSRGRNDNRDCHFRSEPPKETAPLLHERGPS